jgi:plastocyanin
MFDIRKKPIGSPALLLVVLVLNSGPSLFGQEASKGGEIRGKITITKSDDDLQKPPPIDRYTTHRLAPPSTSGATMSASAVKLSERAVVYLEIQTGKVQSYQPPAVHPILDQRDLTFHPQVLPVLVGTTVDFPNKDNLFHNVFSYSSPKEFDLGRYPTGDSKSVRFDKTGVVRVYCDIHSHMNATILVLDNPFFAVPDDGGSFVIKNIPNGMYMARLWYGRELAASQSVTIKNGESVSVNFTY